MKILASLLILLVLSIAGAQDSSPQWTWEPWSEGNASASGSLSSNLSLPDFAVLNLSGREPQTVAVGKTMFPFQEYGKRSRSPELWLKSGANWTQYHDVQSGDLLEIIAYSPFMGRADLYYVDYSNSSILHRSYDFGPGYHNATLKTGRVGRIMLLLTVDNQPSNALVIDILPPRLAEEGPKDVGRFSPGFAWIAITSNWLKGYDVYIDGVFYSSDLADGSVDGNASFKVGADSIHTITVLRKASLGQSAYRSEHTKRFLDGYAYMLQI